MFKAKVLAEIDPGANSRYDILAGPFGIPVRLRFYILMSQLAKVSWNTDKFKMHHKIHQGAVSLKYESGASTFHIGCIPTRLNIASADSVSCLLLI